MLGKRQKIRISDAKHDQELEGVKRSYLLQRERITKFLLMHPSKEFPEALDEWNSSVSIKRIIHGIAWYC